MLFELLELVYMLFTHEFIYWPFHLMIFLIIGYTIRGFLAKRYKPYKEGLSRDQVKVSVVIPEYKEELSILEKAIRSAIYNKPDEIIIVCDDGRKEEEQLIKKLQQEYPSIRISLISHGKKLGKRGALALGWLVATGDIIVQLDSDTIMEPNTIDEIIKPFADPKVAGVQGHPLLFNTGSRVSYVMGQIIELARDVVCKMLNGFLVVIDGKIAAYRRDFLIKNIKNLLLESWGNSKIILADDRALTYFANEQGYKTVYQSTAIARSAAEPTLYKFITQQLRWARSGYLYLIKDIKTGLFFKAPRRYRFQEITYLLSPVSFTAALIQTLFLNVQVVNILDESILLSTGLNIPVFLLSLMIFLIGLGFNFALAIELMKLDKEEIKKLRIKFIDIVILGLIGLFIIYPMTLYAMLTYRNVTDWLTR
ncbi:glycosyltransferase [Stygiolobus sp. RP850M]|uniref:glycosyltransferase n=1 Tax=Stygiolobus sp. RP850M TaxID=3133137 RepID=UPI00307D85EE